MKYPYISLGSYTRNYYMIINDAKDFIRLNAGRDNLYPDPPIGQINQNGNHLRGHITIKQFLESNPPKDVLMNFLKYSEGYI